ncbi:MAG: N-acetylmuramoyl-L-alanine amidase [Gemmatimonadaceae bacterium]|nr:N-acetylmuramoyl-L-alanine amidase [Gemmatimonadaceae bacterium]
MMTTNELRVSVIAAFLAAAACAPRPPTAPPVPAPVPVMLPPAPPPVVERAPIPDVNPALPAVPHVTGPLEIKVVYPPAEHLIQSRDSNFVFGSVGNGDAGLTVNGVLTPVWPNGAFMAWVPNPPADSPRYEIVATTGLDTVRLTRPVRIALPPPAVPLPRDTATPGDTLPPGVPPPTAGAQRPPADTVTRLSPVLYASLIGPAVYPSDTDRVVTGYAITGGLQRWFLMPGTVVKVIETRGTDAHVQLDSSQVIRIAKSDLTMLAPSYKPIRLRAGAFRVQARDEWTDIVIPLSARPAHLVEVRPGELSLILYNTSTTRKRPVTVRGTAAGYLASARSEREGQSVRYTFALRGPAYGYLPLWEEKGLRFRIRRPPAIDSTAPLKGLTIAVDPGHPPIGATGPTGLWEPVPALAVGLRTEALLREKGANVAMTRTTDSAVALNDRPAMARRANSHAFVSIHFNAVPDGINPIRVNGTATYHYHLHSFTLAEEVQRALVRQLSLRDNGVKRDNFAVIRGTWMPSVLAEGAFLIMPDQEAAIRTPEYQERYARGIVEGLESYFRALARARR